MPRTLPAPADTSAKPAALGDSETVAEDMQALEREMRLAHIRGVSRRRGFTVTMEREPKRRPAPDLVNRRFRADEPDQLWVADMTYIPTWTGFMYRAAVLDAYGRKVVGWSMGERMTADLVVGALNMALHIRGPNR